MFAQTNYAIQDSATSIIAALGHVGWAVTSVTEWKTHDGYACSIDMVRGMSDAERELRQANITLSFKDEVKE